MKIESKKGYPSINRQCELLGVSRSGHYRRICAQPSLRRRESELQAICPNPNTSKPHPEHKIYPYLLRNVAIERVDQVWSTDITYIPMSEGHVYLCAVMDWKSRYVISWSVSCSMDGPWCRSVLQEALLHGSPEVFNTDQGSQFTSPNFVSELTDRGIKVSMDGRGRALDSVFVERLWRTVKYENVYLKGYENMVQLKQGLKAVSYTHLTLPTIYSV